MTEYGGGPNPQPWHPDDPLYGDQGWTGHAAQQGQPPYVDDQQQQPQHPHYVQQQPQHPQYVQQQHPGQYQQAPYQQAPYPQAQQAPQHQQPQQHQQQPQYVQQVPHPQQHAPQQHQETYGGQIWDTGQAQYVGVAQAADPYAGADPYAQQQAGGYPGETPDLYGTPDAYPPPRPRAMRHLEPEAQWQDEDVKTDEADEADDSFLGGGGRDGDDDGDDGNSGGGRRSGRSGGKPKKRSGMACLIAAVVIVGVLGGGGYYGYTYLKGKFGAAEDFAGSGTDETVDVEIPKGAYLGQMGRILKDKGVVASAQAFVNAANADPKGKSIQPGIYPLKKKMSAASVVALMTDPTKLRVITVTEGMRNATVYKAIDEKLNKPAGTTEGIAKSEVKNLGLPAWANNDPKIMDPLEGFLYPMRYDLTNASTPESLLKQMVKNATDKYTELGVEGKAKSLGLQNPLQVITVASLVNAEGKNHDDFRKMSEVVYNRLKKTNDVTNQKIEFDSTYNYIKNQSEINFNLKEAQAFDHPYNTHHVKGLPPGPIGNPSADAVSATLDPDHGGWMFFVSVDGNKTTFTKTYEEHLKLVAEFQERQKQKNGG